MLITVNQEGLKAIQTLCDVALKAGGIQNLDFVNKVLVATSTEVEPEKETKT